MASGSFRRRSTSSRARVMTTTQVHAVVYHLLRVQTERDLTEAQDKFLDVLIKELVHRNAEASWVDRCKCMVCTPALPFGPHSSKSTPPAAQ